MRKWGPLDWMALAFILMCVALGIWAIRSGGVNFK